MVMSWLALVVALVAAGGFLFTVFVRQRTHPTWWFDIAQLGAGFSAGVGLGTGGGPLAAVALFVVASWFLLTRLELGLGRVGPGPGVGQPVPSFRVMSGADAFTEQDLLARAPAVVIAFRGWWCPFCVTQLSEVRDQQDRLRRAGLTVFALSVDPVESQQRLVGRIDGDIVFLSDPGGDALDQFGLRDPDGIPWYDRLLAGVDRSDISRPATFVIDGEGTIVYAHRSTRIDVRAPVDELVAVGEALA